MKLSSFEGRSGAGWSSPPSASVLNELERANLFIIALDDRQEWYRYHRLFADLLRKRLRLAKPELAPRINGRASRWFERNGNLPEAIEYGFSAGDHERAAHLIERAADQVFRRSETGLFLAWVQKLSDPIIQIHPRLGIYYSLALLINNRRLEEVEARIDEAVAASPEGALEGESFALRGLLSMLRGDIRRSIQLSQKALEKLPEDQVLFQSLAADNLGMCYVLTGDMGSAILAFEDVVRIARSSGNMMMAAAALSNLAGLQYVQGHLRAAWANYQKIFGFEHRLRRPSFTGGRKSPIRVG
jgi:LuxR family transcriptional regulator, maltose regulon positive regulatory protein